MENLFKKICEFNPRKCVLRNTPKNQNLPIHIIQRTHKIIKMYVRYVCACDDIEKWKKEENTETYFPVFFPIFCFG